MQGKVAGGSLALDESVSNSQHVLPQCIDIVTRNRRLSVARQTLLRAHYAHCIHCQVMIGTFLRSLERGIGEKREPVVTDTLAQANLYRLKQILHSLVREDIPAYIDTLEEHGEAAAGKKHPAFAEHLDYCQDCQNAVEETRRWLQTADKQ